MKYKIFVSGVQEELKAERRAVKDFITNEVLLSEYFDVFLLKTYPPKVSQRNLSFWERCGIAIST